MIAGCPRPAAPFSRAVGADGRVVPTGRMPTDTAAPSALLPQGAEAGTRRVTANPAPVLGGIGPDRSHGLPRRCVLTGLARGRAALDATHPGDVPSDRRPARTTGGVTARELGARKLGALVAVDCIARRPTAGGAG
jgi:enamine deaminase RidA (YjgF/YER057c/UK114 family)